MEYADKQLIRQFLKGDEKAFDFLVEKYLKPLFNFVYQMTRDKEAAEDIVQEVFVKAWKNLKNFDAQKKFSTWIFAIAKNATLDWLRKKKTVPFSFFEKNETENFLELIEDEKALHSEEFLRVIDNRQEVEDFLAKVPLQTKTILILHHLQGFSLVEIAEIMGHSSNTVKSQYRRVLLQLRKNLSFKKTAPESSSTA